MERRVPAARGGRRRGASILLLKSSQRASATAIAASGIEAVSLRSMWSKTIRLPERR